MNARHTLAVVLAAAVLALTACTSSTPNTDPTPTPKPAAVDAPTPAEDMTQAIVDLSWAQQTEADKDAMCFGLALYGTSWGAEQMRIGAGDESVDWNRAAVLVQAKCAQR